MVVMWLLEGTDYTDTSPTRLAVEPDQLSVMSSTRHVLLFHVNVHQTVMFSHLHTQSNTPGLYSYGLATAAVDPTCPTYGEVV